MCCGQHYAWFDVLGFSKGNIHKAKSEVSKKSFLNPSTTKKSTKICTLSGALVLRAHLGGGLSYTALCQPLRWLVSLKFHGIITISGSKLFFCLTIFAPSDIVVQGYFQVVSVILAPFKSNLCALLIAFSFLRVGHSSLWSPSLIRFCMYLLYV